MFQMKTYKKKILESFKKKGGEGDKILGLSLSWPMFEFKNYDPVHIRLLT